jgi:hypothetical protein
MGLPLVVPDAGQLRLLWSVNGQLAVNVLAAHITGPVTFNQALADTLGSAIKAAFTANLATHMGINTSLVRVGIRDVRSIGQAEFKDGGAAVAGTAVGDNMPSEVCAVITLRTAGAGKSFRGRVYLSGWAESENTATGLQAATVGTSGVAFIGAINTALLGSSMELAVMTRPQEKVVLTETTTHADGTDTVRTLSTQTAKTGSVKKVTFSENRTNFWETQRRRNNGRGVAPALTTAVVGISLE